MATSKAHVDTATLKLISSLLLVPAHHNQSAPSTQPRAYKRGRGHAPCVHNMAWQNSNQPAGYAKFRLRALRSLSSRNNVSYQFTVQAFCTQGHARTVWKLLFIAPFF